MSLFLKVVFSDDRPGRYVQARAPMGSWLLSNLQEAVVLANKLECGIEFAFNERDAYVLPGDDPVERLIRLHQRWGTPETQIEELLVFYGVARPEPHP